MVQDGQCLVQAEAAGSLFLYKYPHFKVVPAKNSDICVLKWPKIQLMLVQH
jgi:hypothetical protein